MTLYSYTHTFSPQPLVMEAPPTEILNFQFNSVTEMCYVHIGFIFVTFDHIRNISCVFLCMVFIQLYRFQAHCEWLVQGSRPLLRSLGIWIIPLEEKVADKTIQSLKEVWEFRGPFVVLCEWPEVRWINAEWCTHERNFKLLHSSRMTVRERTFEQLNTLPLLACVAVTSKANEILGCHQEGMVEN